MINFCSKENNPINKFLTKRFGKPVQMSFECSFFYNRKTKNNLFCLDIRKYKSGDHTPMIALNLEILGWEIIDAGIYNIHHEPVEEYIPKCEDCKDYGTRHGLTHQCGLNGSGLGTDTIRQASNCSDFDRYYEAPKVSIREIDTSEYPQDQADAPYKLEPNNE